MFANVVLMLARRLRRRDNIKTTLVRQMVGNKRWFTLTKRKYEHKSDLPNYLYKKMIITVLNY